MATKAQRARYAVCGLCDRCGSRPREAEHTRCSKCREDQRIQNKTEYHKDRLREAHWKHRTGIAFRMEYFQETLDVQGGVCLYSGVGSCGDHLCLEHDHQTEIGRAH